MNKRCKKIPIDGYDYYDPYRDSAAILDTYWKSKTEQKKYMKKVANTIGLVIIEFNRIEWQLNMILEKHFRGAPTETASAITCELIRYNTFSNKIELLRKFFKSYSKFAEKT